VIVPLQVRSNQLLLQAYYQAELADGVFFQTAITDIPNPGISPSFHNAFAVTFRLITRF
jgi:carbohydrate-selective porin OprB